MTKTKTKPLQRTNQPLTRTKIVVPRSKPHSIMGILFPFEKRAMPMPRNNAAAAPRTIDSRERNVDIFTARDPT